LYDTLQASRALQRPLTLPSAREAAAVDHQKAGQHQADHTQAARHPAGVETDAGAGGSSSEAEPALETTEVNPEAPCADETPQVMRRTAGSVSRAFGQTPPEVRAGQGSSSLSYRKLVAGCVSRLWSQAQLALSIQGACPYALATGDLQV
jgi:hypothetical protein